MAMYPCPKCGKLIDDAVREVECPHCLCPLTSVVEAAPEEALVFTAPPPPPVAAVATVAAPVAPAVGVCGDCGNRLDPVTNGCPASGCPSYVAPAPPAAPPVAPPPPPPVAVVIQPAPAPPPPPPGTCSRCGCASGPGVCADCATLPTPSLVLCVEGHETVRWRGRLVTRIAVTTDELLIGRRDVMSGIYPDVDLRDYYDRKEGYVARRHAQVVRERGKHYLIDLAGDERTAFAEKAGVDPRILELNDRVELTPGCRVVVGLIVGFVVAAPEG